jgi:glycerol-3-phosphate dehydrogenase
LVSPSDGYETKVSQFAEQIISHFSQGGIVSEVAVIGGGIAALGIARAFMKAGVQVALFEREKIGGVTSAASLRIIHGGFRYLQNVAFRRVFESMNAQAELMQLYPELIEPLRCVMPLQAGGLKQRPFIDAACLLYRSLQFLSRVDSKRSNGFVSPEQTSLLFPSLPGLFPRGALLWHDAYLSDHQALVDLLVEELRNGGVEIYEHTEVRGVELAAQGYILTTSDDDTVHFNCVVNASGAWLDTVVKPASVKLGLSHSWCKAFNLVINKPLGRATALGVTSPEGRLLFFVPHGETQTRVGTWYNPLPTKQISVPSVDDIEIHAFVDCIRRTLPTWELTKADVIDVEVGVLPRKQSVTESVEPASQRRLLQSGAFIDVLSTKYTTFLSQGREVVRNVLPLLESRA